MGMCRYSYLEGVRHSQTNYAWAQCVFSHHRKNGGSQDHTITNKLQIYCQPPVDIQYHNTYSNVFGATARMFPNNVT